ncbi:hypothetical protein, partial [Acerihabitans arboris]
MLQSVLFITNVACNTPSRASPSPAQNKKIHTPVVPAPQLTAKRQTEGADRLRHDCRYGLVSVQSVAQAGEPAVLPPMALAMQIKPAGGGPGRDSLEAVPSTVASPGRWDAPLTVRAHAISKRSPAETDDLTDDNVMAQTRRVADWLIKKHPPAAGDAARRGYALINQCIESLQEDPGILPGLARRLCKPSGDFGAHREELLSETSQYRIFNRWLEALVFKPGVGEFIARAGVNT